MKTELFNIFNEKQVQAIKDCIIYGVWGDTSQEFGNDYRVTAHAYGYCTNDIKYGGRFSGKALSGLVSGISKTIKKHDCTFILNISDWWGDGSGDMMFFNMDELEATYKDLYDWAKED